MLTLVRNEDPVVRAVEEVETYTEMMGEIDSEMLDRIASAYGIDSQAILEAMRVD